MHAVRSLFCILCALWAPRARAIPAFPLHDPVAMSRVQVVIAAAIPMTVGALYDGGIVRYCLVPAGGSCAVVA